MSHFLFDYDDSNLDSILSYSEKIIDKKLIHIIEEYNQTPYKTYSDFHSKTPSTETHIKLSSNSKGQYGNYIEKYFYGYQPNNDSVSDFAKVNVELKVTPFKVNKNGTISAKERLVLTIINFLTENLDNFYQTHLWEKCKRILLLFYNGAIPEQKITDYTITKYFLFEWFAEDMDVILEDYKRITNKIKQGKAHELSESDGNYLSTCTKGAGKGKDFRAQPFSEIPAKQRAWELKASYMTYLINHKIFNQAEQESILATVQNKNQTFTQVLSKKIIAYKGFSESELYQKFSINSNSKNRNNLLIRKILGLTGDIDKTQEFQKANMNLRVIRINPDGLPKEDSPFKTYSFQELASNNDWESSHPYLEIYSKRFLFVVFQEDATGEFRLQSIKFWGTPERLLGEFQRIWQETRQIINDGVILTQRGTSVSTNFPKSSTNKILFTKLHASNSYYEVAKGHFVGKGSLSDTNILPNGQRITKHSFWFSKNFLKEVLSGKWD